MSDCVPGIRLPGLASFRSLAEISAITADQNVSIIGGQMASLLLTAFPVPGIALRRTRDADAAITTELAGSGIIHERLLNHGYAATSGNSYTRPAHVGCDGSHSIHG
jgi:hypothetical protein